MQIYKLFLWLSLVICSVSCSKFLAVPYNSRSHYFSMKRIADELAHRGHQVVLLAFEKKDEQVKVHENIKVVTCEGTDKIGLHEDLALRIIEKKMGVVETMQEWRKINMRMCSCILNDTALIKQFKTCDVMINDMTLACGSIIKELLNIRRVTFVCGLVPPTLHSWYYGISLPLSYIPSFGSGLPQQMNFFQRVHNVIQFSFVSMVLYYYPRNTVNMIKAQHNITTRRDCWESECDSELILIQTDFAINYALPLPPGAIAIGPLSPQPAKPLPEDLDKFMNNAGPEGVVVVSFGSEAEAVVMGDKALGKMMRAFGQLKQLVLWKLRTKPDQPIPQNIKILPWIPQNDVLGHNKTRAFVTHMGHNGMFEAAYHKVPMVGAPLIFDQHDNAQMMETAGLGIAVDIRSITADELAAVVQRVIQDPSFSSNAARVSRLLRDRMRTPVQEAADHMEYLVRHGSTKHLRPAVFDIPWYQYYLIDVIAFMVAIVTTVLAVFVYIVRCLSRLCTKRVVKIKTS